MATSAMGAALSALGNTNESERSQTQAAISSNINVQITDSEAQKQKTGKTAEEALQSLNRDVANANQKLDKQDLTKAQERQESTQIVAEIGAKRVGDFAKYMGWEDGSPQKIALHGLIGYLSAKVGGGNTTASTLSAMGSEYINTEIANYLQENTALTADQRNAIQQASAAGLGALIGASLGGDSNTVNQSVQMAWRTEKFNRQLHPDEMKWIKAHAKEFAEREGLTVEEAEKRLSQQAAKELDILWFLKLDSSTDDKAKAFLASQNNATFIDSKGDVQHYFLAKDNDFWTPRKYASDAYDYMQATGDNFYGRNLQTDTTVWEGTKDKLGKAYDHISENKLETAKAVGSAVIDSVVECGSDVTGCLGNFVAELWAKGTSSASEMGKNLVLSDQEKINALYGQDVEKEMVAVSSSQFIGTLTEALGIGKVAKMGGESVVDGMGTIVEKGLKSIDLQNLSRGATLKLPDGKYTYLGDGVFEGPDKGKIINTGKVDPATGNSIYQRINPNGSFSSSFLMISDDGIQIRTNKPKEDRLTIHQIEKNKLAGEQFEQEQYEKLVSEGYSPQKQVIVETPSGVRTILDFVIKENGIDICIECKSSATAPLTKNQKIAFPEIKEKGAIVISSDKEGYPKGTLIQPTEIKIERK